MKRDENKETCVYMTGHITLGYILAFYQQFETRKMEIPQTPFQARIFVILNIYISRKKWRV
jgi:hypothetical protein